MSLSHYYMYIFYVVVYVFSVSMLYGDENKYIYVCTLIPMSLGSICVFGIERCTVYAGKIYKNLKQWEFI